MVVHATMRNGAVTLQFHPDAPVAVDHLVAMVHRGGERFRLSADYQLSFTPFNSDWDGLVQEIEAVLAELRGPLAAMPASGANHAVADGPR